MSLRGLPGKTVAYEFRVTNQGAASEFEVRLFPATDYRAQLTVGERRFRLGAAETATLAVSLDIPKDAALVGAV